MGVKGASSQVFFSVEVCAQVPLLRRPEAWLFGARGPAGEAFSGPGFWSVRGLAECREVGSHVCRALPGAALLGKLDSPGLGLHGALVVILHMSRGHDFPTANDVLCTVCKLNLAP